MPRKQAEKVTSIEDKKHDDLLREANHHAEALTKGNPSAETKKWADEQFEAHPSWRREYGDLTAQAMDMALGNFWLGYMTKKGVTVAAESLKAELGYAEASPVERMMIEHAVMCHVRLGMMEHLYSRNASGQMNVIEHWEKRLTLAQRRFTRAVTTLARVRGLLARADSAREAAEKAQAGRQLALARKTA
jgi:hypothetical protein